MSKDLYVGIDVSKEFIDVHLLPTGDTWHVDRTPEALSAWIDELPADITLAVLEATGGLECCVAAQLYNAGIQVAIINPRQIRNFAGALNTHAKTDALDAKVIACFAAAVKPEPRSWPSEQQNKLRNLIMRRRQLVDSRSAEKNRLHACSDSFIQKSLTKNISWLTKQIAMLDKKIDSVIKQSPAWSIQKEILTAQKGVGEKTAHTLLAVLPELGRLNCKEIASLAGLAPYTRASGKWKGKSFISGGREPVRAALYMAVRSASRHHPDIAAFYNRLLAKGKDKSLARTACMRKLLTILNAVMRDNYYAVYS
jgi:transposase